MQDIANVLKELERIAKMQANIQLLTLTCVEQIGALKAALFSVDGARQVFDEQLALEQAASQKQREELEMMLHIRPATLSTNTH
jgi:hypothetical protein